MHWRHFPPALARTSVAMVALAVALPACSDSPTEPEPVDITEIEFAPELGVDLDAMTMTQSGVYYEVLVEGDGKAAAVGDSVTVDYTAWLADGTQFDSSLGEGGEALKFPLGQPGIIVGFQEGILGMLVGETRLMAIPPERGYGSQARRDEEGNVVIPPNSVLVFEVMLLEATEPPQ